MSAIPAMTATPLVPQLAAAPLHARREERASSPIGIAARSGRPITKAVGTAHKSAPATVPTRPP